MKKWRACFGRVKTISERSSKINHAVKLDVDERGVEGAAATAVQINFRSGFDPERVDIVRPFYFSISNRCWSDKGNFELILKILKTLKSWNIKKIRSFLRDGNFKCIIKQFIFEFISKFLRTTGLCISKCSDFRWESGSSEIFICHRKIRFK